MPVKDRTTDAIIACRNTLRLSTRDHDIATAAEMLRRGLTVAFPTETVYGLGADATQAEAVARIFGAKERPSFNPLISHVANMDAAFRLGSFNAHARRLAETFWPGPLTLVVPHDSHSPICDLTRAGLDSVALRVPGHALALQLLEAVGRPIAAPSANRSGRVSPTTAHHVLADLDGCIGAVIDGGQTVVGLESTIISCLGDEVRLLRPGGVSRSNIEKAIGFPLPSSEGRASDIIAPGMLASHYAPKAKVRLDVTVLKVGEAWLGFGPEIPGGPPPLASFNLSPSGNLLEAAANLFSALRLLDDSSAVCIATAPIPTHGLGEAINDRLARAAAPR